MNVYKELPAGNTEYDVIVVGGEFWHLISCTEHYYTPLADEVRLLPVDVR